MAAIDVTLPALLAEVRAPLADPTRAYLASLSPAGRATMIKRLRAVARLLPANGGAVPP